MSSADFLLEIGTEELPPRALRAMAESLSAALCEQLTRTGVRFHQPTAVLASPRRLAVIIVALDTMTPDTEVVQWGPPRQVAFAGDGSPTRAALAFAERIGVSVSDLAVDNDGKAEKLVYRQRQPGQPVAALLPGLVQAAAAELPIPKRMRWASSREEFVRPVHWLVMLHGNEIVDAELWGVRSGRESRGHRFHHPAGVTITAPARYVEQLAAARVQVDVERRKAAIHSAVVQRGRELGGTAVIDDKLLEEVTALVEWPVVLSGRFDARFLEIPPEALVSSMAEHQKYFHVVAGDGRLLPYFITVANIDSSDPAQVVAGNERVIRPRLSDATFFFDTDRRIRLEERLDQLRSVVFQQQLGSLYDKAQRISALAGYLAKELGMDGGVAQRAGLLAKADLVSSMVLEFDQMQGIAGSYYARHDGEPGAVVDAIREHYQPRFSGDALPASMYGCLVALADRLDTLVGVFGIGQAPTGSRDPFALRRASLAVLRILVERELPLDLRTCLAFARGQYGIALGPGDAIDTLLDYMLERFRSWYEEEGVAAEVFMSVAAKRLSSPLDIDRRVKAVHAFSRRAEAAALASANKRVSNILAGIDIDSLPALDAGLLTQPAEIALATALVEAKESTAPHFATANYNAGMQLLADLQSPVDRFFDDVMVMAEDPGVRANRLALLVELRQLFLHVADISFLVPAK